MVQFVHKRHDRVFSEESGQNMDTSESRAVGHGWPPKKSVGAVRGSKSAIVSLAHEVRASCVFLVERGAVSWATSWSKENQCNITSHTAIPRC
jgi:hypothetical protein